MEITIINDDVFEEFLETFTLSLAQDPAGSIDTITISPDAATVTIQDNDGKLMTCSNRNYLIHVKSKMEERMMDLLN